MRRISKFESYKLLAETLPYTHTVPSVQPIDVILPNISHKKPVLETETGNNARNGRPTCSFGESKINDPLADV